MGHSSTDTGYSSGGAASQNTPPSSPTIAKFPFAHDTNSAVHSFLGLGQARQRGAGHSSTTHGYLAGGLSPPFFSRKNIIDKFPFSNTSAATDVGDLAVEKAHCVGQSSTAHGYVAGGSGNNDSPLFTTVITSIEKFPFSSDASATEVGDLSVARGFSAGQSSISHGYTSGGYVLPQSVFTNVIDKFPFSSDGTATDVGDISKSRGESTGHQS